MTLTVLGLFLIIGLFCIVIVEWVTGWVGLNIFIQTFLTAFTVITGLLFILIELPRILALTIDNDKIVIKNLLTRKTKHLFFETIDGFKISSYFRTNSGLHFELILLGDRKIRETISLSYIDNLDQIMKELEKRLQDLTQDEYGFLRYIREQQNN